MDTRAHVQIDYARFGVAVVVHRRTADGMKILRPGSDTEFERWEDADQAVYQQPSYRFTDDVAKALLDALLDHYRGGHDARQLRKDYEDERKRVDKLIDFALAVGGDTE